MAPGEVLAKHTSRELTEWMAYFVAEDAKAKQAKAT